MKHRGPKHRKSKPSKVRAKPAFLHRLIAIDVRPGEVAQVVVAHQTGCGQLHGGACTCDPDMTVTRSDGRMGDIGDAGVGSEGTPS